MICKCGYQNEPDDFYCAQCGRKLGRKKGGKGWIIAIVAVLLVAALAVGAWFLFRGNEPDPVDPPTDTTAGGSNGTPNEPSGVRPGESGDSGETHADGWDESGNYYYLNGEAVKGRQEIDGEYYCFSEEDGRMLTGWQQIGDDWYYYTEDGPAPGEGWYEDDIGWFYLEADGRLRTKSEEFADKNRIFTLDEDGYLVSTVYKLVTCETAKRVVTGDKEQDVLLLPGSVAGCTEFTFIQSKSGSIKGLSGELKSDVWVLRDDIWVPVEGVTINPNENGSGFLLTFAEPQDMSGIYIGIKDVTINNVLSNLKTVK